MNVLDYITEALSKGNQPSFQSISDRKQVKTDMAGGSLDGFEVHGSKKSKAIYSPLSQWQFFVTFGERTLADVLNFHKIMLLQSFDIPTPGLSFAMSEDNLWNPTPQVAAGTFSLTGYVLREDFERTLLDASLRQFSRGLLTTRNRIKFHFYAIQLQERQDLESALAKIYGIGIPTLNAITQPSNLKLFNNIDENIQVNTDIFKFMLSNPSGYTSQEIIEVSGCRLSNPAITQSQSSSDLALVKVDVAYAKAKWKISLY